MMKHLLFFTLLITFLTGFTLQVPRIPTQFYAETRIISTSDGSVDNEQHDFIWYNGPTNKMKVISVDDIFNTNTTIIYRGDTQREYYIMNDNKCYYHGVPSTMKEKLVIMENSSLVGTEVVGGVLCQVWEYQVISEVIRYYLRNDNLFPVKMVFELGNYVTTISFIQFKNVVPDNGVFELKHGLVCEGMKRGISNDLEKYFDVTPTLTFPKELNQKVKYESNSEIDPSTLILIGKTLWAIIKENKPEANLEANTNAVIPKGANWTDMSGWKQQKWPGWQWTLVNGFGATTVDYKWSFNFLCNGNYLNIGKYIENAAAFPMAIDVAWGYNVNVKGQVLNPFNYGTISNPIAGLTLSMTMDTNTVIKKISQTCIVNLIGDCTTQMVSCNGYKSTNAFRYLY